MKIICFVIILLSKTVVRTLSRQPLFYTVRYSFPLFCIFPRNRKTRRTEVLRASYVCTQSYLSITLYIIYLLISDYSMIVATFPDPTVRPPSRYQTGILQCANGDFSCDLWGKIQIFHCARVVFGDFVIMVLSPL